MGSRYLTNMADVLRAAGLNVVEEPGWQTRARGSGGYDGDRPWVIMWHHTASDTSPANDVSFIINADDGPLSNLYLARSGAVHVIAAGATNTNGKGGPLGGFSHGTVPLDSMNTHAIGIEAANNGVGQSWPKEQIDAYFAINNALADAYGLVATDLASHEVWAPGRKIDPAQAAAVQGPWRPRSINSSGTWNVSDMRQEADARDVGTTPPPPPGDDVEVIEVKINGSNASFLGYQVGGKFILWVEWVNGDDANQLHRFNSYKAAGIRTVTLNWGDVKGVGLLGPVPTGDGLHDWTGDEFGNTVTA